MRYRVKKDLDLLHAGEIGEKYSEDDKRIYLGFANGDQCGYLRDEIELHYGGLTADEESVMEDLVSAWNKFVKLEKQHPCDNGEFCDGIHRLQGVLALRPLRRQYPDYWKSYKE